MCTAHEPKGLNRTKVDLGEGARHTTGPGSERHNKFKKYYNASPSTPSEMSTNIPNDDDGQEFLNDWDEWSEHEVGNRPRARWEDIHYDFNTGKIVTPANAAPMAPTSNDSDGKSKVNHIVKSIPCMPCVHQDFEHREKFSQSDMRFGKLFNAMVSRPVGRKEMMEDPDASGC